MCPGPDHCLHHCYRCLGPGIRLWSPPLPFLRPNSPNPAPCPYWLGAAAPAIRPGGGNCTGAGTPAAPPVAVALPRFKLLCALIGAWATIAAIPADACIRDWPGPSASGAGAGGGRGAGTAAGGSPGCGSAAGIAAPAGSPGAGTAALSASCPCCCCCSPPLPLPHPRVYFAAQVELNTFPWLGCSRGRWPRA